MSMENAGIKRDEMAERMGVTRATITRWTHDIGSPPRVIYLERWADVTGVPLGWLRGGEESRQGTGPDSLRYRSATLAA
ncbi:MAG: family transcriptional regulator [Streptosporangiaceae bacterium]|nr:family transcriptional regulator [Streptosporangiaceae bacterium]